MHEQSQFAEGRTLTRFIPLHGVATREEEEVAVEERGSNGAHAVGITPVAGLVPVAAASPIAGAPKFA